MKLNDILIKGKLSFLLSMDCKWLSCVEIFDTSKRLYYHLINTHVNVTNESKDYTCKIKDCNFPSYNKTILRLHMTKHSTFRPFECEECFTRCKTEYSLKRHLKKYHLENSFKKKEQCIVCNIQFRYKKEFEKHKQEHDKKFYNVVKNLFK